MSSRSYIITIAISVLVAAVVLYLIRRRKLREQYALLWLAVCLVMIVLSLWRSLLEGIANLPGIHYAPSALFLLGLVFESA